MDENSIDWQHYPQEPFPYLLRQDPGPENALGRIKFIFPNEHFVFMHDTPNRKLFDKDERMFSSGCIRVEDPFDLAERLLNDPVRWSREKIIAAVDSLQTKRVHLTDKIPVAVLYWTAGVEPDGTVVFKADPYERDAALLAALDRAPVFVPVHQRAHTQPGAASAKTPLPEPIAIEP